MLCFFAFQTCLMKITLPYVIETSFAFPKWLELQQLRRMLLGSIRKRRSCLVCCPVSGDNGVPALEWKVRMGWQWGWREKARHSSYVAGPLGCYKGVFTVRQLPEGVMILFMLFVFCVPFCLSWYWVQLFVAVPACLRYAKENMGRGSGQIWANVLKGKQLK